MSIESGAREIGYDGRPLRILDGPPPDHLVGPSLTEKPHCKEEAAEMPEAGDDRGAAGAKRGGGGRQGLLRIRRIAGENSEYNSYQADDAKR